MTLNGLQKFSKAKSKQRIVVITVGSGGVGAACAFKLANEGAKIIINYSSNYDKALEVVEKCKLLGGDAVAVKGNVALDADCVYIVKQALDRWGHIDALINTAAITQFVPLTQLDGVQAEDFLKVFGVNAVGPFQMARAVEKHMPNGGAIVSVSSIAAQIGSGSSIPYVLSKAALNSLTLTLARALAPRIRVNAVLPGMIEGNWMSNGLGDDVYQQVRQQYIDNSALGCISQPEQIASAVCWLLEKNSVITGQNIVVDAGFMLGKLPSAAGASQKK